MNDLLKAIALILAVPVVIKLCDSSVEKTRINAEARKS